MAAAVLVAVIGSTYIRTVQTRAKADVTSANARANQHFNLAMNAIKVFRDDVTAHPLLQQKSFDRLRTSLLTNVSESYDRLQEDLHQIRTDRESLAALGKAYEELGGQARKSGGQRMALALQHKGLAVRRALASQQELDAGGKLEFARCLIVAGFLERSTGDKDAARTSVEEARDLAKEAGTQGGDADAVLEVQVAALRLLARLRSETGDRDGALTAYRDVLDIRQKRTGNRPSDLPLLIELADSLVDVAQILGESGRGDEAIAYFDRQEKIWLKVVDLTPAVADYRQRLAHGELTAASVLLRLGRPADARARCERAVAQCELLMNAHPDSIEYRRALATGLLRLGQAHQAGANFAGADWRRAAALLKAVSAPTGELLFIDAGCHASMSSLAGLAGSGVPAGARDSLVDRATSLLRQAHELGYRDRDACRSETALDPLRDRGDFRLFMMDLDMPADPVAPEP